MTVGKPLMTVTLGIYPTAVKLRNALEAAGCMVGERASVILGKMPISLNRVRLELFEVDVTELGLLSGSAFADILSCAETFGFMRVPAEVGPLVCLHYKDGHEGKKLFMGMDPLADDLKEASRVFRVGNFKSQLRLTAMIHQSDVWGLREHEAERWVFCRA